MVIAVKNGGDSMLEKIDIKFLNEVLKDETDYFGNSNSFKENIAWFLLIIRKYSSLIWDYICFVIKWCFSWIPSIIVGTIYCTTFLYIAFAIYASIGGKRLNNLDLGNIATQNGLLNVINYSFKLNLIILLFLAFLNLCFLLINGFENVRIPKMNKFMGSNRTVPYLVPSSVTIWEYEGGISYPHIYLINKYKVQNYINANYDDIINLGISGKELTKYVLLKNKSEVLMYFARPLTDKYRLSFVDKILFKLNILDIYRNFTDVEVNDVMYLEKVVRHIKNEKIERKVIKKSIY